MRVISFGRASSNDVVVNDPMVSSNFHMKLVVTDDNRVKVVDCNSTNGTFVNGRKVPGEVYINRGDIIISINGTKVGSAGTVSSLIGEYAPGDTIQIMILRDGKEIALNVTLAAYPSSIING